MPLPPVPEFHPLAQPEAVVSVGGARFSVLTDRLIRLEFSKDEHFEDRPSQAFWHRWQPVPAFKKSISDGLVEIETDFLHLKYIPTTRGFSQKNLSIRLKQSDVTWKYGDKSSDNLLGTARTLDGDAGTTKLENGLLSKSGWAVMDDSDTPVFTNFGWVDARDHVKSRKPLSSLLNTFSAKSKDLYFFGYGTDYAACLSDYIHISGPIPMIPRYILGNWWSRYWEYTQDELKSLMQDFQANDVPLSVCIIDMDWHITKTGNKSDGWTGYTWNRKLFPDPEGLIEWFHSQGLRTALNLHPANGVYPHEEQYTRLAEWMGVDPASQKQIPFDIADPRFMEGYFDILHHPFEEMVSRKKDSSSSQNEGVDFWWMDYQQKKTSNIPGLDPLWLLNHLHYQDLGRDGRKRPFVFSRWGGLGNHRYPIGFSGDTFVRWRTLAFQPYFTSTAANVAYGWWSHDLGGHMMDDLTPELYLRWLQFGVFSPIFRMHSTKRASLERRPWMKPERIFKASRSVMQLRYALIPYIYSMAWKAHKSGISLVAPMYYGNMDSPQAFEAKDQYFFGSELIAAPITEPANNDTHLVNKRVWLPDGTWTHFFTGEHFIGNQWHAISADLEDIPVFAKPGAIVPLAPFVARGGVDNPDVLDVYVFPGADNSFELYEDDGLTTDYQCGEFCITRFTLQDGVFTIHAANGNLHLIPASRTYRIHLRGVDQTSSDHVSGEYNSQTRTLSIEPFVLPSNHSCSINFKESK
ncbi:MAG TPA: alpha-xylosidase [Anaerolineaceae bacterium]|nr:alpha-xylosidase [Anaerolineaceae bacterium]